jgi:hypothetical protein
MKNSFYDSVEALYFYSLKTKLTGFSNKVIKRKFAKLCFV